MLFCILESKVAEVIELLEKIRERTCLGLVLRDQGSSFYTIEPDNVM